MPLAGALLPSAKIAGHLLKGGPQAQAAAKKLIADVGRRPMDDDLSAETARRIAAIRVGDEARIQASRVVETIW